MVSDFIFQSLRVLILSLSNYNHRIIPDCRESRIQDLVVRDICRPVFIGNLLVNFLFMRIWLWISNSPAWALRPLMSDFACFVSFGLSLDSRIWSFSDVNFGAFRLPIILHAIVVNPGHTLRLQGRETFVQFWLLIIVPFNRGPIPHAVPVCCSSLPHAAPRAFGLATDRAIIPLCKLCSFVLWCIVIFPHVIGRNFT